MAVLVLFFKKYMNITELAVQSKGNNEIFVRSRGAQVQVRAVWKLLLPRWPLSDARGTERDVWLSGGGRKAEREPQPPLQSHPRLQGKMPVPERRHAVQDLRQ